MPLPNPNPALPESAAPIFQDNNLVTGVQLRGNNQSIWGNLEYLLGLIDTNTGDIVVIQSDISTIESQIAALQTGWIPAGVTLAYASGAGVQYGTVTASSSVAALWSVGTKLRLVQSTGGTKHCFVGKVDGTTVSIFLESGKTIANEAMTDVYYSFMDNPYNWPQGEAFIIEFSSDSSVSVTDSDINEWLQPASHQVTMPPGNWSLEYWAVVGQQDNFQTSRTYKATLTTSSGSESDPDFTSAFVRAGDSGTADMRSIIPLTKKKCLLLTTNTTYYLNILQDSGSNLADVAAQGDLARTIIRGTFI